MHWVLIRKLETHGVDVRQDTGSGKAVDNCATQQQGYHNRAPTPRNACGDGSLDQSHKAVCHRYGLSFRVILVHLEASTMHRVRLKVAQLPAQHAK